MAVNAGPFGLIVPPSFNKSTIPFITYKPE